MLIVEDDDVIASGLFRALAANGYDAERTATGAGALARVFALPSIDLVLLDLGLPDLDGLEVCRRVRAIDATLPIVMLTARREEIDIVVGLDAGALDYVTKPFRLAELLARIRVQMRRPETLVDGGGRLAAVGDVSVDRAARRVWVGGEEVHMRTKEFDLLAALFGRAGTVVTRELLMAEVWDENWFGSTKTLDVHLSALRRRLGEQPGDRSRITSVRSVGYRYETS